MSPGDASPSSRPAATFLTPSPEITGRCSGSSTDWLERVARGERLWQVHEAVFAVLALESEPVDPRL
jgi:hypothetical protein